VIRRAGYWASLLALVLAWFTLTSSDGRAACQAAAPPPPLDEYGTDGISYFPPGYNCLYIDGRNTVEPLDAAGWVDWSIGVAILVMIVYGALRFVAQLRRR
jgi:hypothetical protein